jgi:uncharacterized membrane protein YphA (DoxX/SURF4 family)
MSIAAKMRRAPLRLTTGAFILNSGIGKLTADDDTSKALHGMAAGSLPYVDQVDHRVFAKALAAGEIALGTALLVPMVPAAVAGLGLTAFSGALMAMWWRTPGMHQEGIPRPTPQGLAQAKDVWMLGAGLSLVLDALTEPAHDKKVQAVATVVEKAATKRRQARRAEKMAAVAAATSTAHLAESARRAAESAQHTTKQLRDEYGPVAAEKAKRASTRLAESARTSADELAQHTKHLRDEYAPVAAEKAKRAKETSKHLRDEYVPVATEKAKRVKETSKRWAESARSAMHDARASVQSARASAHDLADDLADKMPGH